LDAERLRRFDARLASARAVWMQSRRSPFDAQLGDELEELESESSGVVLDALLDRIEAARRESLAARDASRELGARGDDPGSGRLLIHRLGASLGTGEAEVAARGFFDVWDRPPLALWLEALSRPLPRRPDAFELAVLVFVPAEAVEAATAGRRACSSGALCFLEELDGELCVQLASRFADVSID
jgi:hypothetical protein